MKKDAPVVPDELTLCVNGARWKEGVRASELGRDMAGETSQLTKKRFDATL